jgi:hypothetical protein
MADRPVISIVTPSYNRAASLERAVASVLAQSLGDFELIIVDDASTDGSADVVRRFQDPRVRLHRFDIRRGANPARNQGIGMSRADLVTFLDSDDEFLPNRLERTVQIMRDDRRTDVLLSSFHTCKRDRVVSSMNPEVRLAADALEHALMAHAVLIAGSAITVRREVLTRCGGFAAHLGRMQDRELLLNIARCQALAGRDGARLLAEPDWVKHQSTDSISAPAYGFVEALGGLMACHPHLISRYGALVRYHVARSILAQLFRGRLQAAGRIYGENLRVPAFRYTPIELLQAYVQGRWARAGVVGAVRTSARRSPDASNVPSDAVTTYRLPERPPAVARKAA